MKGFDHRMFQEPSALRSSRMDPSSSPAFFSALMGDFSDIAERQERAKIFIFSCRPEEARFHQYSQASHSLEPGVPLDRQTLSTFQQR